MARSVGDRRTRPRPARVGIRHLQQYLPPPAALCGRVRHAFQGGPDCSQPQDHGVVPGMARHAAAARDKRDRALLCRPSDDVRRALAQSAYRPERTAAWLVLSRRSAYREHLAPRARTLFVAALLAVAMELRSVERERPAERGAHPSHARLAGGEPSG